MCMALKLLHRHDDRADPESTPLGINLILGTAVMTFACLSIGAATSAETTRLAAVAVALGCCAVAVDEVVPVLLLLPVAYLFFDGFLLNSMGHLTWDGRRTVAQILVLGCAVAAGLLVKLAARTFGDHRPR